MKKAKTRQEIAEEYGISRRTLQRWLKKEQIRVHSGLITPKEQEKIYRCFGYPFKMQTNPFALQVSQAF